MNTFTDWANVEAATRHMVGNWRRFQCFAWSRGYNLPDADQWSISYTSNRDAGLLEQSNHAEITIRLVRFTEGDDPEE